MASLASYLGGSSLSRSGRSARAADEALSLGGVALGAFGTSYLAAKSRLAAAKAGKTGGGELAGVPYTLLGAVVLGAAGLSGVGGKHSAHLLNMAKGSVAAFSAAQAVKMAFAGSGVTASVGALPAGMRSALSGAPYALSGDMYATYGATPETEQLFREAGL